MLPYRSIASNDQPTRFATTIQFHGSGSCIQLAYGTGFSIHGRINFDEIDRTRPVFVRYLLDSASAIALTSNDIYSVIVEAYLGSNT